MAHTVFRTASRRQHRRDIRPELIDNVWSCPDVERSLWRGAWTDRSARMPAWGSVVGAIFDRSVEDRRRSENRRVVVELRDRSIVRTHSWIAGTGCLCAACVAPASSVDSSKGELEMENTDRPG